MKNAEKIVGPVLMLFWSVVVAVMMLSCVPAHAQQAQPVEAQAAVSWTLPTVGQPGNVPLTGANALTRLLVWASTAPIPDDSTAPPTAELPPTATSWKYTATVPNGSTLYFRLKAATAAAVSAFSAQAAKPVLVVIPGAPAGVQVTVTVTVQVQ